MNAKKICLFLILIFSSMIAYSETELETLWDNAASGNIDIASAAMSLKNSINAFKNKRSLYPFNLKLSTESVFSDIYKDVTWYPSNAKAGISVSKLNPYGNSISGSVTYGVGRNIMNFLQSVNPGNIGYIHSPEININIEQSLLPAFFQGYVRNPEISILKNKILNAEYSKDAVELSIKQNIANLYVQERNILRHIEKYKSTLKFYDEQIDALNELYKKDQGTLSDIWKMENKRWDCYREYIESLNTKENIELSLKNICGETISFGSTKSTLPKFNIALVEYNPTTERMQLEIENIIMQNIISKQSYAPKLSFGGSFSETTKTKKYFAINYIKDKSNLDWNFSLGLSFSEFLSPSRRLKQQQFEDELILGKERLRHIEEQSHNQKENYTELIILYEEQIEGLKPVIEKRKALKDDYEHLYKTGKCSKLEFDEANLSVIEAEFLYENLSDYLWLYKWMRTQCR